MRPDELIARASNDLALAADQLAESSYQLFYGHHYIAWRNAEVRVEAIRYLSRQAQDLYKATGLSLPEGSAGLPPRSEQCSDQRSVATVDG